LDTSEFWLIGRVKICLIGHIRVWLIEHISVWLIGRIRICLIGHIRVWLIGHIRVWLIGHMRVWLIGHIRQSGILTVCRLVNKCRHFGRCYCLHLQCLAVYTMRYSRRTESLAILSNPGDRCKPLTAVPLFAGLPVLQ